MKPTFALKIAFMILALVMVVGVIRGLNSQNMEKAFESLGLSPGNAESPGIQPGSRALQPGEERFGLCRTRIVAITWPDGRKIEERKDGLKLTWTAADPANREVSYLDVEKWLSRHCQVIVRAADPGSLGAMTPLAGGPILIKYVDGNQSKLEAFPGDIFRFDGRVMKSTDLMESLIELQKIAQFNPATGL